MPRALPVVVLLLAAAFTIPLHDVQAELTPQQTQEAEALIEQLRSGSEEARREAVTGLEKLGDARAVEPLIEAVVRGPLVVSRPAADLLDRLQDDWRTTPAGRNAFDTVLGRLSDPDPGVRKQAIFVVRMFRTRTAADPLIARLSDEDEDVRRVAIQAVPGVADERAVGPLLRQLVESRWPLWSYILLALREIEPEWYKREEAKALVPVFLARLKEGGHARYEVEVLGELRDERAVEPLIAKLPQSPRTLWRFVVALGKLGDPRAVKPLIRRLTLTLRTPVLISDGGDERRFDSGKRARLHEEGELWGRNQIVGVLDRIDPDWRKTDAAAGAVASLTQQLSAKDAGLRETATWMLGELGTPAASKALIGRLKDDDLGVRESACLSLAKLRAAEAVPALALRLKARDEEGCMRVLAARTLGELSDPRAVEPLFTALLDHDPSVRQAAAQALGRFKEKRVLTMLLEATKDRYDGVRVAAGRAIGNIGDTSVVPALVRQLESPERGHRHAAGVALGALADPRGIEALIRRLERDRETGIPQWGPEVLGESRSPQAVDFLCSLLDDHRLQVNLIAAGALGRIRDPRAVTPLIGALRGSSVDLRAMATALGEIGDARAVEPLLPLLLDEHETVRWPAATALRKITGQDFGTNADVWRRWWQTQKPKP